MAIIYYGSRQATIGIGEFMIKCPACEAHHFADAMFKSNYYHIYFIPIFPYDKEVDIICQQCGLKRIGVPLDERLFSDFAEIKRKYKHPWYTYLFTLFFAGIILYAVLTSH